MAVVFPYVKQTWTDDSSLCNAARNNVHEDGIFNAHNQPAVRVFHNANQSINSATDTILAFNSERIDQAGGASAAHHDNVTNNSRLTCLYAGVYMIGASIEWGIGSTGLRLLEIILNATTRIDRVRQTALDAADQSLATLYPLAVNDFVTVQVHHTQGAALNVLVGSNYSPEFWMVRVA